MNMNRRVRAPIGEGGFVERREDTPATSSVRHPLVDPFESYRVLFPETKGPSREESPAARLKNIAQHWHD